jgi:serine/threonine protein kinase
MSEFDQHSSTCGVLLHGRYALEEKIGQGRMAHIFRARDLQRRDCVDGTFIAAAPIAVKLLRTQWRSDPVAIEQLQREFRQMRRLAHSGVARVFYLGRDGEVWFMTMELIRGRTVTDWLGETCSRAQALRFIHACADALDQSHACGVVHGDLKPGNVLLDEQGQVKLIDFGGGPDPDALHALATHAAPGSSALYASPQVLAGSSAEVRDDIFSLACLSYAVLTGGRHPFGRRPVLEDGRVKVGPTRIKTLPPELFSVIERGLAAEPAERPRNMGEFQRALQDAAERLAPEVISSGINDALPSLTETGPGRVPPVDPTLARPAARTAAGPAIAVQQTSPIQSSPIINWALSAGLVIVLAATALLGVRHGTDVSLAPPSAAAATAPAAASPVESDTGLETAASDAEAARESGPQPDAVTPRAAGLISFETPTLLASPMQPAVAVSVRRVRGERGSGAFRWHVEGGTAYPGVDFARMPSQVVRFQEGQTVRTLYIPLLHGRGESGNRPRDFTVWLQSVAGGPAVGRIQRLTVTIEAAPLLSHAGLYQASARP